MTCWGNGLSDLGGMGSWAGCRSNLTAEVLGAGAAPTITFGLSFMAIRSDDLAQAIVA